MKMEKYAFEITEVCQSHFIKVCSVLETPLGDVQSPKEIETALKRINEERE